MDQQPMEFVPLWCFFLLSIAVVTVPLEIGYRIGTRFRTRHATTVDASLGVIVGSILALLAFMLAFTFNIAASKFDERRQIVLNEANDIGTTYLRTALLPEKYRAEISHLLREYVDVRIKVAQSETSREEMARAMTRTKEIQDQLWKLAIAASEEQPTVMTSLFLQALNETIDIHGKRVLIGLETRIPMTIWLGLFGVTFVALLATGFQAGLAASKRTLVTGGLILSLAGVMTLISDLDRPRVGTLRSTQAPMLDLQESMNSH